MSLNKLQYDEIIREYNKRQLNNKREQLNRINYIYEKYPRIKDINDSISSLSLNTTKLLLNSSDKFAMSCYKQSLSALRKEKENILLENGFSKDYLSMNYICRDCQDTGYINNKKCHCFKQMEIDILYNQSNIKEVLWEENFNKFTYDCFNNSYSDNTTGKTPLENIKNVVDICKNYIATFNTYENAKYRNLLFFGETGVGKTFLTNCIAKELIESSHSVIYLSAIKFFEILGDAEFNSKDVDAKYRASQIANCDLLIIDDLGTELSNAFTNSALFNCINERLLNKNSTIISTNLIFTELMDRYSERITSRLAKEYTFLKIFGDDLRHNRRKINRS